MIDISSQKWLKKNIRILIAFSGGVDSRVLFDVLNNIKDEYNLTLYAFHLDHNLRNESKDDARFVDEICSKNDVTLFSYSLDIASISKEKKESIELTARKKRYELIDDIMVEQQIDYLATAHHMDDNVETFLLHLFRGSGTKGLSAMKEVDGNIIRPLIQYSKDDIEEYASSRGLTYKVDKTNLENKYSRNKIRNELIPLLEDQYSTNIKGNIIKAIHAIRTQDELIDDLFDEMYDFTLEEYPLKALRSKDYNHVKTFVLKLLEHRFDLVNVNSYQINLLTNLIRNNDSGHIYINDVKFSIESGYLVVVTNDKCNNTKIELNIGDHYFGDYKINVSVGDYIEDKEVLSIPKKAVVGTLYARSREPGDRFRPKGMKGTKKLKDFFIDSKIRKSDRDSVLIISDDTTIYSVHPYRKSEINIADSELFYNIIVYKIR